MLNAPRRASAAKNHGDHADSDGERIRRQAYPASNALLCHTASNYTLTDYDGDHRRARAGIM